MMRSLFSGVSGLKNHQTRMDVIGNNISNVNTTGFKSSRVTFTDMLSQTLTGASAPNENVGGTNPKQIGLGSSVAAVDMLFTNGSVQSTGKNTDLCLSGDGLFVVKDSSGTYYTRNGAFEFDADGNYVLPGNGMYVQGWMAQNGSLNTSGEVGNIQIPSGKPMAAAASTRTAYSNNLNSSVPIITEVTGGKSDLTKPEDGPASGTPQEPITLILSDGTEVVVDHGTYTVGDTYPGTTATVVHSNPGESVVVSKDNSPVTAYLVDGQDISASEAGNGWSFGYETKHAPDSDTATTTKAITLTSLGGKTGAGISGTTYVVGEAYEGKLISTAGGSVTTNGDAAENIVWLYLEDGTKHDVTTTSATYNIGTDSYSYTDSMGVPHTSKIKGYTEGFIIDKMKVSSPSGTGATVTVGGIASHTMTGEGDSVKKTDKNEVTLTLDSGATVQVTTNGTISTVGKDYISVPDSTTDHMSGAASKANRVVLTLGDGTTVEDSSTGTDYKVGGAYSYTKNGVTVNTTIASFSIASKISAIQEDIKVDRVGETAMPTIDEIKMPFSAASADEPVTVKMSDGSSYVQTSGRYAEGWSMPVVTTITVYDTLGAAHDVTVYFTKTKTDSINGNEWTVSVNPDGSGQTIIKEPDGTETTIAMPDATLSFKTTGAYNSGDGTVEMTLTNGSTADQKITLDLSAITQYSGSNTIAGKTDGNAAGTLSSVSIDSSGIITGTYSNGIKQAEAQVAVAQFNNASGLTKAGDSLYQVSNNSGDPNVKTAADLGVKITPSALEMSNVDVANEFTDMIITQRGFQSNSKIITVSDEMLETVVNMKR